MPEVALLLEYFRNERVNRALDRINRLLLRKAAAVVAIGETMARRLVELKGADPATVALSQGLEAIIDPADSLRDLTDVVVLFQGNGIKREPLASRARRLGLENVRFVSYVPAERLGQAFGAADVQVVSLRRGLAGFIVPSKLYGILASGRPYVAAVEDECEVAALTARYESGLVVPPGEPEMLAKAIRRLYEDPTLRERLGANALRASAFYDRPVAVAAYDRLLTAPARGGTGSERLWHCTRRRP
jgi:colanic acid biosynthesis glycosyl transferase WcaI